MMNTIRAIRGEGKRTHLTTTEFIAAFDKEQQQPQQQQQQYNWSQHIQPAIDTLLGDINKHRHYPPTLLACMSPQRCPL